MPNDLVESHAGSGEDPVRDLESREEVEDFACAPSWQPSRQPVEASGDSEGPPAAPQLTLSQALDLLEVETAKRRLAEEGMKEKEERFRQMSRYLGKFLWLSDAQTHKLIYVSPGYEQVWHTTREACYARPEDWLEDTPPPADGQPKAELHKSGKGGKSSADYQAVGPDGSLRWIRERICPIQDSSGKILYTLGIAEDITELKSLEAAFDKSEVVKRAFLRLVPDTILKVRQDGLILEFKAAKDDPDLRPAIRLRGRNVHTLLPEPAARQATHAIHRALSTGRIQSLSLQLPVAGTLRSFELRGVACGEGEVLVLAHDATQPT